MNRQFIRQALGLSMRWLLPTLSILIVAVLLMAFAGVFHRKVPMQPMPSAATMPAGAFIATVQKVSQPRFESAIGTIRPVREATIASKVLARVVDVTVTAGQTVRQGEVLVRLNDEEQQARMRQAEADRDLRSAEFELARIDFDRAMQLVRSQSISQAELDGVRTKLQTTQANLDRSNRAIEESKVFLDYTTIVAPFDGKVIEKSVQTGDTVTPGQPMLTLYDPRQMQLVANVRESLAMKLQPGQQLNAEIETLGLRCFATVSEVVPKADASSRSFEVKVTGPCPDGVYSGMFGRLLLPLEDEDVLLIPKASVHRVGQLTFVKTLDNERWLRRSIQLGRQFEDQVEVLSGLKEGEQIMITDAQASGDNQ